MLTDFASQHESLVENRETWGPWKGGYSRRKSLGGKQYQQDMGAGGRARKDRWSDRKWL